MEEANDADRQAFNVDAATHDAAFAWADAPAEFSEADAAQPCTSAPRADGAFAVWPANWPTVQLFLACQTQWKVGGMGGLMGLDYPGVNVVMDRRRVRRPRREFVRLQAMEFAALEALSDE